MNWRSLVLAGVAVGSAQPARAMIFASTSNATYNTTAPTGALTNSGWQWLGGWSSFIGTPIAPRYFLTAKHVAGTTNQVLAYAGQTYRPVERFDDAASDLTIWRVAETFPSYAPLFTGSNEVGQAVVVYGRGLTRGAPVEVAGELKGWLWSNPGNWRWGENVVASITNGGAGVGQLLRCTFDQGAGSNECHLALNDSGGSLYLQEGATWKLAGIHSSVDAFFSTNGSASTKFNAALFDMGGLYLGDNATWRFITNQVADIPSAFYSTRISARMAWINSVIDFELGNDLRITSLTVTGSNAVITFVTTTNKPYRVEYRDALTAGTWQTLTNQVLGTGNPVSVIDPGAAGLPQRFYRVGLVPP
jgi:hypothetical protein